MSLSPDESRRRFRMRLLQACSLPGVDGDAALERLLQHTQIGWFCAEAEQLASEGLLLDWHTTAEGMIALYNAPPFTGDYIPSHVT